MTKLRVTNPPALARWLLAFTMPTGDRQVALGDLHEEFQSKLQSGTSLAHARLWYWRQVIQSLGPNIRRHLPFSSSAGAVERGDVAMMSFIHDLRYAFRSIAKQPGYSLTVLGMLTLGIAGNTAIFSVFNGLFLRPLPFSESDRLVNLDETAPQWNLEYTSINFGDFVDWRDNNETFASMAVFRRSVYNLSGEGEPVRLSGASVSHDMASVLRLTPVLGRHFAPEEDVLNGPKVVQLAYGLWQDRYGSNPDIVGTSMRLDGEPYTIIGVLPPEASFIEEANYWIPLQTDVSVRRGSWWLSGIGRLNPGVTIAQAREDLTRIHKNAISKRRENEVTSPVVLPILDRILGDYRLGTSAMLGAVGLVLLIACANIAGLMLARSLARRQEIAIRVALGAGRWRVTQQLLTESFVLAITGAVVGTALGFAASNTLRAMTSDALPAWVSFSIDGRVIGFTLALTITSALLFGLAPAVNASRGGAGSVVGAGVTRVTGGRTRNLALNGLVSSEIALATVLLVAAGLAVRDFQALQRVDPGFQPENVLSYRVSLPFAEYDGDQRVRFFDNLIEALRALPGVVSAGGVTNPPLSYHQGNFFQIEGNEDEHEDAQVTLVRNATPGYIEAIGVTMVSGRSFEVNDAREGSAPVVIVNETFANHNWPGEQAVGKRIRSNGDETWATVIGVAKDVKHYGVDTEMRQGVYRPHTPEQPFSMGMIVRTATDPQSLVAPIRALLRSADPDIPMSGVTTLTEALSESLWARRAASWLAIVFSAVALALAVGGIYGVVSYNVSQRTKEIGIRMALGARPANELSRVLGQGALVAAAGITIGLIGALGAGKLLASALVDVSAVDPLVYGVVVATLFSVAIGANLVPARRAARFHPAEILRGD